LREQKFNDFMSALRVLVDRWKILKSLDSSAMVMKTASPWPMLSHLMTELEKP